METFQESLKNTSQPGLNGQMARITGLSGASLWRDRVGPVRPKQPISGQCRLSVHSQPTPSPSESRSYGSDPVTVTKPVYAGPFPEPPAQS